MLSNATDFLSLEIQTLLFSTEKEPLLFGFKKMNQKFGKKPDIMFL
jgi:hypothetical protein